MFVNKFHEEAYNLAKKGELHHALGFFEKALQKDPGQPDIYSDRGVSYLHLGMKTEALADFDLCIEIQPDYSYRYSSRAYARDFFGDTAGAIEDYERAVALDPDDSIAYNNLGLLQEKIGYNKKAKENFERADRLSKIENHLYEVMDELEQAEINTENQTEVQAHEMKDPAVIRDTQVKAHKEFSKIFTSKSQFKEFLKFIRNGFRIK
jgi:tetratricopeptide (TPR) repeat protein